MYHCKAILYQYEMENDQVILKDLSELVSFTSPEGNSKIELMYDDEMFWFSQKQISSLFNISIPTVNYHLKKLHQSPVLQKNRTIRYYLIVQKEGNRDIQRTVAFHHLDAVIAVGFRISSQRATRFKEWATQKLREYILEVRSKPRQPLLSSEMYVQDIPVGDALIHCEITGREDTPALVFLHGNGEDLRIFDSQIRYFSKYYKTIALDTRSHGLSTKGTAPFNFYTFAADLISVLDALHISKAHIVGFSDGAITALYAALTAQERIASMVLIGVNYNTKGLKLLPRILILLSYIYLSTASLFSTKMRRRKKIWGLMVHQPNLTIGEISRITVPALVVTGEKDMVRQDHNDEISRAIVGSKRFIVQGGNHFWMLKKPETLQQCVMEFLTDI